MNLFKKRPMFRPLLLWIIGILVCLFLDASKWNDFLLILTILVAFYSSFRRKNNQYHTHHIPLGWMLCFSSMLLFLSIEYTQHSIIHQSLQKKEKDNISWYKHQKEHLLEKIKTLHLEENAQQVLGTIALGKNKKIPREIQKKFSATGVAHILAVSGFHVGIIAGFIFLFLNLFKIKQPIIKCPLVIGSVWLYTLLSGASSSTIRAAIMLSFYAIAPLLNRRTEKYNILFASAFCMLIANPLWLFDIGFQLSYAAVASILYFYPLFSKWNKISHPIIKFLMSIVYISIAAQIGTFLLSAYYFKEFSIVFLFTNIPVTLLSMLIIPLCFIWLFFPFDCFIKDWIGEIIIKAMNYLMEIIESFSQLSIATCHFTPSLTQIIIGYSILFCILLFIRQRNCLTLYLKTFNRNK